MLIGIVGKANVGKSTLFNCLTRTRDAIVSDQPGVTRDRQYGFGEVNDRRFIVVDTGGIAVVDDTQLSKMTETQIKYALNEADVVLFVVDAKAGVLPGDLDIAKRLRRDVQTKIVLVINKIDRSAGETASAEFYELGLTPLYTIAANTGRGIDSMMTELTRDYPAHSDAAAQDVSRVRITIVGRPNVGKSTLVNRLLGEERVIVLDSPGTTRDSIAIPYDRFGKQYLLIDTAGIRRRTKTNTAIEKFSVIKAIQSMERADIAILVFDAQESVTEQDLRLLGLILQAGIPFILAFNKWDHLDEYVREQFTLTADRRLTFVNFARRYFISALHGTGVGHLYDAIDEIQTALSQQFETASLMKILMQAVQAHQPPLVRGRRIRLRYVHVGSRHPFTLVIHGKQIDKLPESYRQYVAHYYREKLHLVGIPLVTQWISDKNPYI